jgi:hypothetical protein
MKMYIAVLDEFPDYMTPTLVAHSVLGAHLHFMNEQQIDEVSRNSYIEWLGNSFKKCVVRVNRKEFMKIAALPDTYLGHENNTLSGQKACAIPVPVHNEQIPNVLKFAKLWKPLYENPDTQ